MRVTIAGLLLLLSLPGLGPAHGREWIDSTGKYRVKAELVAVRGDKVILEKEDGTILSLPTARLSVADREFLRQSAMAKPVPERKPTTSTHPGTPPSGLTKEAPAGSSRASTDVDNRSSVAPSAVAGRAMSVLKQHCFRCHGEEESEEGGFGFTLDREKLVASGYVLPKDPKRSPLLERMVSEDSPMPPEGESPRPSSADIKVINDWIRAGAPSAVRRQKTSFVSTDQMFAQVADDLESVAERDRPYTRYFSITHLANAGVSPEELATYRLALAKLVNSLSWNRRLARLKSVGSGNHLFRIDLRDLKWTADNWKQILAYYPHGLISPSPGAFNVRTATSCEIPVVRADWFVATASRPPLYHDLIRIPSTDKRLEDLLQVNVQQNIEQGRTVRAGFARSGVSQNNRVVERHESVFGAYWKSYDFAGSTGRKNLFENPLGPGSTSGMFAHDGGEIIFRLPNGMLGYMLTDEFGRRIDRGPIEIVSDPRQPDRTVVNGVSCMSCHYGGFIQKSDEIRKHVLANETAFRDVDSILGLYPEPDVLEKWIKADTRDYLTALAKTEIGMTNPTRAGEPIVLISNRYQNEVDAVLAAAELGLQPESFQRLLKNFTDDDLRRTIGALKIRGGVVKRQAFDQIFVSFATRLRLGTRPSGPRPRIAPRSVAATRPSRITPMNAGDSAKVPAEAEQAFRAGIEALKKKQWQVAQDEFEIALRMTKNATFVARVYEHLILIYERGESVDPLINAHKYLLDACNNGTEIEQARTNFYNSLFRFVEKPESWSWQPRDSTNINWRVELPTSISSAVAAVFEKQLEQTPDHEPTLRVMQTYWHRVRDNPQKRTPILIKLIEMHHARGDRLDSMSVIDSMFLLTRYGEPNRGAEILAQLAESSNDAAAAQLRISEAEAWIRADKKDEAIAALKSAQTFFQRQQDARQNSLLVKIGDLYTVLMEPALASGVYRSALKLEKNSYQVRAIQEKVAKVASMSGAPGDAVASDGKPMDALLDPLLPFRMEAEKHEESASSSPAMAVHSLKQAAESWIKAEEPERAAAALKRVANALRRTTGRSAETDHVKLASLYQKIDRNQEALNHLIEALKLCQYDFTIQRYQDSIGVLLEEDDTIKVAADAKELIDPNYKFRAMARVTESKQSQDARGSATYFVKAAELWSQAGDTDEVKRVGLKAETAIRRLTDTSRYPPQETLHLDLAKAYETVSLHEAAIRNYVGAIGYTTRDHLAVKYHQQISVICEESGLPVPKLDAESAVKLDPLNKHRVKARDQEQRAEKETNPSSKMRYWMYASQAWLDANEKEHALDTANRYARLLLKQEDVRDYDVAKLSELYQAIGAKEQAIKALERAIEVSTSDYQKKKYRERINAME